MTVVERETLLAQVVRAHAARARRASRFNRMDLPAHDGLGLAATMDRIRASIR